TLPTSSRVSTTCATGTYGANDPRRSSEPTRTRPRSTTATIDASTSSPKSAVRGETEATAPIPAAGTGGDGGPPATTSVATIAPATGKVAAALPSSSDLLIGVRSRGCGARPPT